MKSFREFITEASYATIQAKRFGYVGDGHGGWYNRATGEFEAKTVGGQLKFYNKNQIIGAKDPKQSEFEKNIPLGYSNKASQVQQTQLPPPPPPVPQQVVAQELPQEQPEPEIPQQSVAAPPNVPKTKGTLVVVFGRFNPPTFGHSQILDTAANTAAETGDDYLIIPSRSQDAKKNPLDPDTKISFMRSIYPYHSERIVNDSNIITVFDVLKKAHNDGYAGVKVITGPDRAKEFEKLANNYNGQLYQFDGIEIVPVGDFDPDGKSMDQLSSSRLRLAAAEGDFITFRSGLPQDVKNKEALNIFNAVRQGMNIQEIQQEGYKIWEIAPEYDLQALRENYIGKQIFIEGDYVESLNTGLIGKIIRRGTNYLICVTESGMMFKSWIKDVKEAYTETSMARIMRLPQKPNTLVGTSGFFKYANTMTPGAIGTGSKNLQFGGVPYGVKLINNNRKDIG
jgi:hypothetical protein